MTCNVSEPGAHLGHRHDGRVPLRDGGAVHLVEPNLADDGLDGRGHTRRGLRRRPAGTAGRNGVILVASRLHDGMVSIERENENLNGPTLPSTAEQKSRSTIPRTVKAIGVISLPPLLRRSRRSVSLPLRSSAFMFASATGRPRTAGRPCTEYGPPDNGPVDNSLV